MYDHNSVFFKTAVVGRESDELMMENNRGMMSFAIYLTSDIAEICDIDQKKDELCIRYQFENCIFSL